MAFDGLHRDSPRPRPEGKRRGRFLFSHPHPSGLSLPACLIFSLLLSLAGEARAQQAPGVVLDSREQLFTLLAARLAYGIDSAPASEAGLGARQDVIAYLSRRKIPVGAELQKFFLAQQQDPESAANLSSLVSLALLIGPPPEFKLSATQTDLPPDARAVAGLIPLAKRFSEEANLTDLWAQVQPRIQEEIERYSPLVRRAVEVSDAYLRFPSGAYLGRVYTIYLSPLGTPEQVHARIYGANYYLVVTPSREPKIAEVRHQYLHFLLDPLAGKYGAQIEQKLELKSLVRLAPQLGRDFKEDFSLLVTECLIRAVELRMDKRPAHEAQQGLEELAAGGLILAPYFYAALADYEKQDEPMSVAYKNLILGIKPNEERLRLLKVKFAPKAEAGPAGKPQVLSPEEQLLNQAENLIADARYQEAIPIFKSVLETINAQSDRALFGLAVIYSNTRKPNLAEDYFKRTLEAAKDVRLATWSHIYLGRLSDLNGEREQALAQYRAASLTAANYPDALRAVQDGLQRPFGFHK